MVFSLRVPLSCQIFVGLLDFLVGGCMLEPELLIVVLDGVSLSRIRSFLSIRVDSCRLRGVTGVLGIGVLSTCIASGIGC